MPRNFLFTVPPEDGRAKYVRIAHALIAEIQSGRLRPGDPLPSTRELARTLKVHRKTIVAAYDEMTRQGFIVAEPARATRVSSAPPVSPPLPNSGRAERRDKFGVALPEMSLPKIAPPRPPEMLVLLGGVPDVRLVKELGLARAYARSTRGPEGRRWLSYGDPKGNPQLRDALADLLNRTRAVRCSSESIAVVRGSQQALYLIARALLRPGDHVAVESLGYPQAFAAFRAAGVHLVPVPLDQEGMDLDHLTSTMRTRSIRAVYLTPQHQMPTTVTLSRARRTQLLALAEKERAFIIEDDYDHEFQYESQPILPLASMDRKGLVIYVGTLSKTVAPSLRIGFISAAGEAIERIVAYRALIDTQGDHALERSIAALIEDGDLERHIRRATRAYRVRRDALAAALAHHVPELSYDLPAGGIAIWARLNRRRADVDGWVVRSADAGVAIQAASRFASDGRSSPFVRLGFAACNEVELWRAAERIASAL